MKPYLLNKALVPINITVQRQGKTFTMRVWINPEKYYTLTFAEQLRRLNFLKNELDKLRKQDMQYLDTTVAKASAGNIHEVLMQTFLSAHSGNINELVDITMKNNPKIKRQWDLYFNDAQKRLLVYNALSATIHLHEYAIKHKKRILGAEFIGGDVGTGKKADIIVHFTDKDLPITDLSKIQYNENTSIGISLKIKTSGKKISLQTNTYKKIHEYLGLPFNMPATFEEFHKKMLEMNRNELRDKFINFLAISFKDNRYKDLVLFIRDYKRNKSYWAKEDDISKEFMRLLQSCEFHIKSENNIIKYMYFKYEGKTILLIHPSIKKNRWRIQLEYNKLLEIIKNKGYIYED